MKNTSKIVRRADITKNYTIIPNHIAQSTTLSPNGKSLLIHLISMPDNWVYNKTSFWRVTNLGRSAFNTAWKELEKLGYIQSNRIKEGNLVRGYEYVISDLPIFGLTEDRNNRTDVNPKSGELINTNNKKDLLYKDLLKKEIDTKHMSYNSTQGNALEILSLSFGELDRKYGLNSSEAELWLKHNKLV